MKKLPDRYLKPRETEIFWGELSPCEHIVEIYRDDARFLDSLESFVSTGLARGEAVIIIATESHRKALEGRMRASNIKVDQAAAMDLYISLDASHTLAEFMFNGWPNEQLFEQAVGRILARARTNATRVRAFGEMVALLWADGESAATIRLEHLWHRYCAAEAFCLFCAYPRAGFTQNARSSLREICAAHTQAFSA